MQSFLRPYIYGISYAPSCRLIDEIEHRQKMLVDLEHLAVDALIICTFWVREPKALEEEKKGGYPIIRLQRIHIDEC